MVTKRVSIFNAQKSSSSQIPVLCFGKIHQHPDSHEAWKKRIEGVMSEKSYRDFDGINGEPTEFDWNFFTGFTTLQLCGKVTDLLSRSEEKHQKLSKEEFSFFMSMFNDISCDGKGNEEQCVANVKVVSIFAKKFGIGQWSFIGLRFAEEVVFYGRGHSTSNLGSYRGKDVVATCQQHMSNFPCNDSIVQVLAQKQRTRKTVDSLLCRSENNETMFRILVYANQLSLYGADSNMCEEQESHHDRSGRPDKVMGQSIVLSEIKAEVPLENDIPSHQNLLLQRYEE